MTNYLMILKLKQLVLQEPIDPAKSFIENRRGINMLQHAENYLRKQAEK